MIITRAPLRIPLGGGGTDLSFYSEKKGGSLITAAINRYVYVFLSPRILDKLIWLSYSKHEKQTDVNDIEHDLIREALKFYGVTSSVEIHSVTDLSERVGVGGSSSFLTALLKALYAHKGLNVSNNKLAEDAVHIERIILKHSGGIQDQYIAAHGGFCSIENNSLTDVRVQNLPVSMDVVNKLTKNLLLFYTGVQRLSSATIKAQTDNHTKKEVIAYYDKIKNIGNIAKEALLAGDVDALGRSFHDHWILKKEFIKSDNSDRFEKIYKHALKCGSLGGKIIGAGGGGFFLFYVPKGQKVFSEKMKDLGLTGVSFEFDFEGTVTLMNRKMSSPISV